MNNLQSLLALDLRALAAFRILLAGTAIVHFLDLAPEGGPFWFSVFGLLAAIAMALGYCTRVAMISTWMLLLVSTAEAGTVQAVPVRITSALLFLGQLIPLGACYSVDSSLEPEQRRLFSVFSVQAAVFKLQIVLVFAFLFVDVVSGRSDWLVANLVHLGLIVALLVALIPTAGMDGLSKRARRFHGDELRIYFDEDCDFCNKICRLLRTFLLLGDTPIQPAQADPAAYSIMQRHDSWVVYDRDGQYYVRWHAVLLLMRRSVLTRPIGVLFDTLGMGRWCDWLYGAIASSRSFWSRLSAALLPYRRVNVESRVFPGIVICVWIGVVLAYNFSSDVRQAVDRLTYSEVLVTGAALNQYWRLSSLE